MTSSKDINIRVTQRKQRIVGHDNPRFEKKLLVMPDRCVAYGCNNKADPKMELACIKFRRLTVRLRCQKEQGEWRTTIIQLQRIRQTYCFQCTTNQIVILSYRRSSLLTKEIIYSRQYSRETIFGNSSRLRLNCTV